MSRRIRLHPVSPLSTSTTGILLWFMFSAHRVHCRRFWMKWEHYSVIYWLIVASPLLSFLTGSLLSIFCSDSSRCVDGCKFDCQMRIFLTYSIPWTGEEFAFVAAVPISRFLFLSSDCCMIVFDAIDSVDIRICHVVLLLLPLVLVFDCHVSYFHRLCNSPLAPPNTKPSSQNPVSTYHDHFVTSSPHHHPSN